MFLSVQINLNSVGMCLSTLNSRDSRQIEWWFQEEVPSGKWINGSRWATRSLSLSPIYVLMPCLPFKASLGISVECGQLSNGSHIKFHHFKDVLSASACYMPIHNKPTFASLRTDRKDEEKGGGRERMKKRGREASRIERGMGRKEKENKWIREEEGSLERGGKGEKEGFQGKGRDADWRN